MIHFCDLTPEAEPLAIVPAKSFLQGSKRAIVQAMTAAAFLARGAMALGAQAPATAVPATARQAVDSTAPIKRNFNWLGDKRAFVVGDIIKVNVDEHTLATATKGLSADAARQRKMGINIDPPSMGAAPLRPIDVAVGTGDAGTTHQNGQATNNVRYVGELAVRVIAVTKEGLLQVSGTKLIDVDKNKQEMTLTGFIRPQDVNSQDMVLSTSIADVQLAYKSKGALGKPKSGILTKIVGIFWP
ncbi:MAG: flagellar basal body L-ring protein FlgH [Gemmatimonadaceae bacterium]